MPLPLSNPLRRQGATPRTTGEWVVSLLLVRSAVALVSLASLFLSSGRSVDAPVLAQGALLLVLLLLLPVASRCARRAPGAWAMGGLAGDLVFFTLYSAAFSHLPGAGTTYGLLTLLLGPVQWGWRGAVLTGLPVGVVATLWPQRDALGMTLETGQTWAVLLLFAVPTAALSSSLRARSARLLAAEQQLRAVVEHAPHGLALLDETGRVVRANVALARLLERAAPQDLEGELLEGLLPLPLSQDGAATEVQVEPTGSHPRWWSVSTAAVTHGPGGGRVVQVEDVSERHALQSELRHQASHDGLTGLANSQTLQRLLRAALERGDRPALLFVDLDRFKLVNDSLGHDAGDQLLLHAAARLETVVGSSGTVARWGGDEFIVLLEHTDPPAALAAARRVVTALRLAVDLPGGTAATTGSVGVAVASRSSSAATLVRDADTAMYAAKRDGGDGAVLFSEGLREDVVRRQDLDAGLRRALEEDRVGLVYQPILGADGTVRAAEALLRVPGLDADPGELVAVAEASELVQRVGTRVLERAVREATTWPCHVALHVNVSLRQLDEGFAARVGRLLERNGLPASRLCLEVTETAVPNDIEALVARLHELRRLGVRLAIDDFGAGHASLTYLSRLPVQEIKIDRSFVRLLPGDDAGTAIVAGVVAMAAAHGMEVVAEGVETEAQDQALRALGCDARQGFLHHRPLEKGDLRALLSRQALPLPRPRHAVRALTG